MTSRTSESAKRNKQLRSPPPRSSVVLAGRSFACAGGDVPPWWCYRRRGSSSAQQHTVTIMMDLLPLLFGAAGRTCDCCRLFVGRAARRTTSAPLQAVPRPAPHDHCLVAAYFEVHGSTTHAAFFGAPPPSSSITTTLLLHHGGGADDINLLYLS